MNPSHKPRGEPWALGAVAGYASAELLDRVAMVQADPLIGPFLRGLPSLALGLGLVGKSRSWSSLRPGSVAYVGHRAGIALCAAGALSTLGLFAYYFAIRLGGVVITVPVLQTYALWGTLVAWFFLGERIHRLALVGVAVLVAGLGLLARGEMAGRPASLHWYVAIPLALFAAVTYGVTGVLWRDAQLRGAGRSIAILVQFVTSEAVALLGLAFLGRTHAIGATASHNLAALLASGLLSGIVAIYCLFTALRLMVVARVYAFASLNPVVAALAARILLHEYLSPAMLAAVALVSGGIALTQAFRPKEERQAAGGRAR